MADNLYGINYLNADVTNVIEIAEGIGEPTDPLGLDIPDDDLCEIIDKRILDTRTYYKNTYDLYARRRKNETYLFGRQIQEAEQEGDVKDYEAKNLDNVLYEIESTIKPLAMSQLPDLLVTPGQETDQDKDIATLLTQCVDSDIKKRQNRRVLAMAFKHLPVYLVGIIKIVWNPQLCGGQGDYEFVWVHPDSIDFDHTTPEADADKMKYISQLVPMTVEEVCMQFPKSREKFFEQLRKDGVMADKDENPSWKAMSTPLDVREVWFTDYKKAENGKWQRVEGVCWKYKDVILSKMKNPNFDYEGRDQVFTYENPRVASSKRALSMQEMQQHMATGQFPPNVTKERVFNNYFEMPRKPYFFMTYDQWGKQPLDETSRLEQNIRNQDTLDKRAKQIEETLNHRGHHVWSKMSGLKPSDIQKMDHNNPDEDYLVDGRPSDVHEFIQPERPTPQEFQDQDRTRQRMYEVSGSQAIRGDIQSDTATTNQIAREANYTRADDLVDDTINPASEWMAVWALQMIKTRYTQEHFRRVMGKKGEMIYVSLHQNLIDDGMEVSIKSSGTDKIKKQNNAMEMAKMQLVDPLTFYEDMDLDDPEGRTAKLIAFKSDMSLYLSQFVETGPTSTKELVMKLAQLTAQNGPQPGAVGGGPPQQPGQPGAQPQNPGPSNTTAVPTQVTAQPPQGSTRTM